jgi:hypothetical protein
MRSVPGRCMESVGLNPVLHDNSALITAPRQPLLRRLMAPTFSVLISCVPVTMRCPTFGAPSRYVRVVVRKSPTDCWVKQPANQAVMKKLLDRAI